MKSRVLVLAVAAATMMVFLSACGSGGTTTVTAASTSAETTAESSATEKRIERVEKETEEAELEAVEAKREAAQQAVKAKRVAARRAASEKVEEPQATQEKESTSEPPDVVGMKLPEAKAELQSAGFHTVAVNTDTVFGIVVPSHYTVCEETPLGGNNVKVLAQKYGC
jgi:beta-lactam-binding protein with PASTA domain